jgi:hypothetical protein
MVLRPAVSKEECVEFGGSSRRPFPTAAPRPNKPVMMRERSPICKLPSLAGSRESRASERLFLECRLADGMMRCTYI